MGYIFNAMIHLSIDVRMMAFKFFELLVEYYPSSFFLHADKVRLGVNLCFLCLFITFHFGRKQISSIDKIYTKGRVLFHQGVKEKIPTWLVIETGVSYKMIA